MVTYKTLEKAEAAGYRLIREVIPGAKEVNVFLTDEENGIVLSMYAPAQPARLQFARPAAFVQDDWCATGRDLPMFNQDGTK